MPQHGGCPGAAGVSGSWGTVQLPLWMPHYIFCGNSTTAPSARDRDGRQTEAAADEPHDKLWKVTCVSRLMPGRGHHLLQPPTPRGTVLAELGETEQKPLRANHSESSNHSFTQHRDRRFLPSAGQASHSCLPRRISFGFLSSQLLPVLG